MSRLVRLAQLIGRYGGAVEHDLHCRFGLDLLDFFRHRLSWRKLDELVSRLPAGSALWAARADDDEAAAAQLEHMPDDPAGDAGADLQEMTTSNQLAMLTVDLLVALVARVDVALGNKPAKVRPLPRPQMALERARTLRESKRMDALRAEVHAAQTKTG